MKKILTTLAISLSALCFIPTSMAAPPHEKHLDTLQFEEADEQTRKNKRRLREEMGFKRLKQHKWQEGYVMPQHYRGNRYKVDYSEHDLPKPNRQQQWYKINNDYVLIDSASNSIVSIKTL